MKTDKFVFFYGGPFSQWYLSVFTVDGVEYVTAEQYMMAMKAAYFDDKESQAKIMATSNPSEQKALGRMVSNFNSEAWDAVSRGFVFRGNLAKFSQDGVLLNELRNTGDRELVEASPHDKLWGIGLAAHDSRVLDKTQWRGKNWLGEVLMKVRTELVTKKPVK